MATHRAPSDADVVVIGAGVAGLRAAAVLHEAGAEVVVIERSDAVGGRVRSDDVDGYVVDRGFQVLNPAYPALRRAVDLGRLGLQPFTAGLAVRDDAGLRRLGHPARAPRLLPGALAALVRNPGEAFALLRWVRPILVAGRAGHQLVPRLDHVPDLDLHAGLDAAGIDGELRATLEAFLAGVVLDEPGRVAQRYVLLVLRTFLLGNPGVPARGVRALPELMAAPLTGRLHLETEAASVRTVADGVEVSTSAGTVRARAAVCAADAAGALRLLDLPAPEPRGVVTQWWATDEAPAADALVHVDLRRRGPLVNTAVMTRAAPAYAPPGSHLVQGSALLSPGAGDAVAEQRMRTHAGEIYGVDTAHWRPIARHEIPEALPALPAPAGDRLGGVVALEGSVVVCGDHRSTPSLQGALSSGERAARLLLPRLGLAHPDHGARAARVARAG